MQHEEATRAIKRIHDLAAEARARDPSWPRSEDALAAVIEHACAEIDASTAAFHDALTSARALRELFRSALDEVLAEPGDPGPYAVISRESPAGNPSNYHLHGDNGITPRGGVGGSGSPLARPDKVDWLIAQGPRRGR